MGAAWCALLLACTTPWLARLSYFGLFGARAEGMFKQLIDAYEHAPAAPSVDQLLKLASHLLDGGLESSSRSACCCDQSTSCAGDSAAGSRTDAVTACPRKLAARGTAELQMQ